eukprot:CAMPEP_0197072292 /NCGR_PEP_ID=MMETSP1384-20130603/210024_1 /TAXON_ID=29189 /ORGANISM="Ammonia sp." /LENGTH=626 /DNA_ID=CAMNT_0042511109 /DNA_START=64 /DNA_END=1944 /DNA_ORIENTATION=-
MEVHRASTVRNKWISQHIDAKHKNSHRRSRGKLRRRSSNSLKQEFRNEKSNLPLLNRLYSHQANQQYSLHKYLQRMNIYDDYHLILNANYHDEAHHKEHGIAPWQCVRCTYINVERLPHCSMCQLSYPRHTHNLDDSDSDTSFSTASTPDERESASSSSPAYTPPVTLSCYIRPTKPKQKAKRRKRGRKFCATKPAFKFNDDEYQKFKRFMAKHKTSIIAEKHGKTHDSNLSHSKIRRRQQSATQLFEMYKALYLSRATQHNADDLTLIARILPYQKFKRFMAKHKTSIIAEKHGKTHDSNLSHSKIRRRQQSATQLFEMYKALYFSRATQHNADDLTLIARILPELMASFVPKQYLRARQSQQTQATNDSATTCKVCYCSTNDDDTLRLVAMNTYCSHCMICEACLRRYLSIAIKDDQNILPWLLCPAQDCKAPIHVELLLAYVGVGELSAFALSFLNKHLQRTKYWLECPDSKDVKCKFGWIMMDEDQQETELRCAACGCVHKLEAEEKRDGDNGHASKNDGFRELLEAGLMRECPECSYPAMKDYGLCNVMQCGKCGVYWNWRTRQTGSTSNEVKQKARAEGSLWEPGELSYQQDLEDHDLPQFIALLQRNGIRYDPNYRRGT